MSRATRAESVGLGIGTLTVLLSVLAAYEAGNFPGWGSGAALALLLVFGVTIAVGEWFQISAPGLRGSAPLATASANSCALADAPADSIVFGAPGRIGPLIR